MKKTEEKVKNYILSNDLVTKKDKIIIGLSGGADSVCLLLILDKLAKEFNFSIEAIHVNHNIRGLEADLDEEFAKSLCENHGIAFKTYKRDIPGLAKENHESEEECGRRIRYEIFREAAEHDNCKIAVAHHMEDQAETVIFRMARGTGITGIAGMKAIDGKIIRPLLCLHKREIVAYLNECSQEYRMDATNEDTLYSRNLIRKEITPLLERVNEGAVEHIMALSCEAEKLNRYIENQAENLLQRAWNEEKSDIINRSYDAMILATEDEVVRTAAIRRIIRDSGVALKDINRDHVNSIDRLLTKSEASIIELPRSERVIIEAGKIYVASPKKLCDNDFLINIIGDGEYDLGDMGVLSVKILDNADVSCIPQSPYTKWFDYDKISNDLCIRTRQSGDYLVVGNKGEKKTLKDYMINEKIPKSERDGWPVLANGNRIAWVIGKRISWDVKVTDSTDTVVEMQLVRKEERS